MLYLLIQFVIWLGYKKTTDADYLIDFGTYNPINHKDTLEIHQIKPDSLIRDVDYESESTDWVNK